MSQQAVSREQESRRKARRFCAFGVIGDPGAGLALVVRWTVTTALMGALGSGCLVTEERTFRSEPDLPPEILESPGQLQAHPVWLDNMQPMEWELRVRVRDYNIGQELWAHWRVVQNPKSGGGTTNAELPDFTAVQLPTGTDLIRELPLRVPTNTLAQ